MTPTSGGRREKRDIYTRSPPRPLYWSHENEYLFCMTYHIVCIYENSTIPTSKMLPSATNTTGFMSGTCLQKHGEHDAVFVNHSFVRRLQSAILFFGPICSWKEVLRSGPHQMPRLQNSKPSRHFRPYGQRPM